MIKLLIKNQSLIYITISYPSLLTSYTSFNLTSLIIFTHFTYANKRATGKKIYGQMDIYKVYKEDMQMRS